MKTNKIVGLLVIIFAVVYPFLVKAISPAHYAASGDFLVYAFSPLLALFGLAYFINSKAGIYYGRIVVGSVFIVSGLIKANDALGFSYKLEEYFEPGALGWTAMEPYSLWLAVLVCVGEVALGIALIIGAMYKLTLVLLTGMMVFFAFLTYYTAQCDPNDTYTVMVNGVPQEDPVQCVLDCGCFGDALRGSIGRSLTPWESFYKDFVLLIITVFLYGSWNKIKLNNERRDKILLPLSMLFIAFFGGWVFGWWFPLLFTAAILALILIFKRIYAGAGREWVIAGIVMGATFAFTLYTLAYLPIKDYRPYAVGNNLYELYRTADDIENEITETYTQKYFAQYQNEIQKEQEKALAEATFLTVDTISDSIKEVMKEDLMYQIESSYEDKAYEQASQFAKDSMDRAGLNAPVYAYKYLLRNKNTGEEKEFLSTAYIEQKLYQEWDIVSTLKNEETGDVQKLVYTDPKIEELKKQGYEKVDPISQLVKPGRDPKIPAEFGFGDDEVNENVLKGSNYVILGIAYDVEKSNIKALKKFNELKAYADEKGYLFYAASSSTVPPAFIKEHGLTFNFLGADEKILKTIVRSNPGVLLIKDGTVLGKWGKHSIPKNTKLDKIIEKRTSEN